MEATLVSFSNQSLIPRAIEETPVRRLPIPWRDPHTVDREELKGYIELLQQACIEYPESADVRTCLGMAHAMNFDVYSSMDALEEARRLEPSNFFAQLKFSELLYRLRALERAEPETKAALDLAGNGWEMSLARKQLAEIRRLKREGTQKPAWTKSLRVPSILAAAVLALYGLSIVLG